MGDLSTTNVLLGVMAVVSVLEAIALIAAGIIGFRLYRQVSGQISVLEERHVAPLRLQASTILDTVQRISARVEHSTTRVDQAVQGTMQRAETAVEKVDHGARRAAGTVVGVVRGVRTAIETFLADDESDDTARRKARESAAERAAERATAAAEESDDSVGRADAANGRPPRQPAFYPDARPDSPAPPGGLP